MASNLSRGYPISETAVATAELEAEEGNAFDAAPSAAKSLERVRTDTAAIQATKATWPDWGDLDPACIADDLERAATRAFEAAQAAADLAEQASTAESLVAYSRAGRRAESVVALIAEATTAILDATRAEAEAARQGP